MDYASDKVKSVRLKLARALPSIRLMLNFDDEDLGEEEIDLYDKALSKLSNLRDKEVSSVNIIIIFLL